MRPVETLLERPVTNAVSKSAKKRAYLEAQALGEKLVGLKDADLRQLPLDDALADAIRDARTITSKSALRRQRQLIGKLMARQDWQAVQAAFIALQRDDVLAKARFKEAERWRDRLVDEGSAALQEFLSHTGGQPGDLPSLISELGRRKETERRALARQIFRLVHAQLISGMPRSDG